MITISEVAVAQTPISKLTEKLIVLTNTKTSYSVHPKEILLKPFYILQARVIFTVQHTLLI
jgi:hypothetical protein